MNERTLREAFQAQAGKNMPVNREQCPGADDLHQLAVATNIGDTPTQVAQLEHVLSCAACRPEFELLRAAHSAALDEDGTVNAAKSRSMSTARRVALAATVLMAAGIAGEFWSRTNEPVVRDGADRSDVALVSPLINTATVTRDASAPGQFVWRPVAGAAAYQVEVLDTAGVVLAQSTSADTVWRLSGADSARVFSQAAFDWMVTARRADGNERRSQLTRVRNDATARR